MPAEADIQAFGDHSQFKNLDSRIRGNDGFSPYSDAAPFPGEGGGGRWVYESEAGYFLAGAVLAGGFSAVTAAAGVQKGLSGMTSFFTFSSEVL